MKKRILLFTAIAGFAYVTLSSYQAGPGLNGFDCTGAETGHSSSTTPVGCSAPGVSCHGAVGAPTTNIAVAIELDSAGIPTTHYKGGMVYTVKITGTNNGTTTLPKFGFQMTAIKGTAASAAPSNAGTWPLTASMPTNTQTIAGSTFLLTVVEHKIQLSATTLGGAHGGTYVESIPWTAPAAGTGTISFWGAINAVDGGGTADPTDLWNTNHVAINEWALTNAVANVAANMSIQAFPNPTTNNLNLQMNNADAGTYTVQVYSLGAKIIATEHITINGGGQAASINTATWAPGTYMLSVEKDGNRQVIPVVKQ